MKTELKKHVCGTSAFTLVETLTVVLVIGVLMMVVTTSIRKSRIEAQNKQVQVQLELLSSAVEQLAWDTGMMPRALNRVTPGSSECWDLTTDDAGLLGTDGDFTGWRGPYLSDIPLDPWGSRYFFDPDYRIDGVMRMVVGSFGPNKIGRNKYDSDDIYVIVGE